MKYVFLKIAHIINDIKTSGAISLEIKKSDDIACTYINTIIGLIKQGCRTEYIYFTADYEVQKLLLNNNIDSKTLKKLYAINHVVPMIVNLDIDGFISFSRYFCDSETCDVMNVIFNNIELASIITHINSSGCNDKSKEGMRALLRGFQESKTY